MSNAVRKFDSDIDMQGNQILHASGIGGGASTYTGENKDSITLLNGTPVTQDASGTGFERANANANGAFCVGFTTEDIPSLSSGSVQIDGVITLTDWTNIAGAVNLTPKTSYFLSSTAGKITSNPNAAPGLFLQKVGVAVDFQTLEIILGQTILL